MVSDRRCPAGRDCKELGGAVLTLADQALRLRSAEVPHVQVVFREHLLELHGTAAADLDAFHVDLAHRLVRHALDEALRVRWECPEPWCRPRRGSATRASRSRAGENRMPTDWDACRRYSDTISATCSKKRGLWQFGDRCRRRGRGAGCRPDSDRCGRARGRPCRASPSRCAPCPDRSAPCATGRSS